MPMPPDTLDRGPDAELADASSTPTDRRSCEELSPIEPRDSPVDPRLENLDRNELRGDGAPGAELLPRARIDRRPRSIIEAIPRRCPPSDASALRAAMYDEHRPAGLSAEWSV